jgi:HPt (histidine-containing phosphotransfer) domain-containing protein
MTTTEIDRIFDAFTQMDQGSTRRFTGAGLGLPISRNLAHLLGGDITVDSRAGCGSTFRATLLRTLSGAGQKASGSAATVNWEDDELVAVLREFLDDVPKRVERLRHAATREEWVEAVAEAHRLGEEADVLQVETLRRATSGLILATDASDPGRVEQAAQDLLELLPQLLPGT